MPKLKQLLKTDFFKSIESNKNKLSIVFSAFSMLATLKGIFNLQVNKVFELLLKGYQTALRDPLHWLVDLLPLSLPKWSADLLLFYLFFGFVTVRTFFSVYRHGFLPGSSKGIWGKTTSLLPSSFRNKYPKLFNGFYTACLILVWPVVAISYLFVYKHIWHRYMDDAHSPNFNAHIGMAVNSSDSIRELLNLSEGENIYNKHITYDHKSDSWWAYRGDFRKMFIGSLIVSALLTVLLIFLAGIK